MTTILILGNSHVGALRTAADGRRGFRVHWLKKAAEDTAGDLSLEDAQALIDALTPADALVLSHLGTMHNILGLVNHEQPFTLLEAGDGDPGGRQTLTAGALRADLDRRLGTAGGRVAKLARRAACPVFHLMPPPPKQHLPLPRNPEKMYRGRSVAEAGFTPAPQRLAMWRLEERRLADYLAGLGVHHVPPPPAALTPEGYLASDCQAEDATHGNARYGALVLDQLEQLAAAPAPLRPPAAAPTPPPEDGPAHPYRTLPDKAFWRRAVARPARAEVDPVGSFGLKITPRTRVATAGSCFAQHVARHLRAAGFTYHVTEPGHPVLLPETRAARGYGTFSARYGNIYTARQLRQLIDRAYGRFTPAEGPWIDPDGAVRDPFRPTVEPGGFASVAEMEADRAQHLAAVREMFETLEVFVFTLGLTECWEARADGAVFPLCPGVEGGRFDPGRYVFRNQDVAEVIGDMTAVLAALAEVNPGAETLLTVSPVPLMATARPGAHVLAATTYSKSVLRVAAETLAMTHETVHYFPSYEVITGPHARGRYFADDLRNVTEEGVAHVMRLLLHHAAGADLPAAGAAAEADATPEPGTELARRFVEAECDEVALDR